MDNSLHAVSKYLVGLLLEFHVAIVCVLFFRFVVDLVISVVVCCRVSLFFVVVRLVWFLVFL